MLENETTLAAGEDVGDDDDGDDDNGDDDNGDDEDGFLAAHLPQLCSRTRPPLLQVNPSVLILTTVTWANHAISMKAVGSHEHANIAPVPSRPPKKIDNSTAKNIWMI